MADGLSLRKKRMIRASRATVKVGWSLRERHDLAMAKLAEHSHHPHSWRMKYTCKDDYWRCVYHWNDRKGVIIGDEPPNNTWPTRNR